MVENTIKEWLSEFASLEKDDWTTFAITTSQNKALIESIYAVFDDIHKYAKVIFSLAQIQLLNINLQIFSRF